MKIKVYKEVTTFTVGGNEVEVTVKCKNALMTHNVTRLLQDIPRDTGILTQSTSEEVEIFKERAV